MLEKLKNYLTIDLTKLILTIGLTSLILLKYTSSMPTTILKFAVNFTELSTKESVLNLHLKNM